MASGSEIVNQMRQQRGQTTQVGPQSWYNSSQQQQQAQALAGLNVSLLEIPVTEEMIAAARNADWACQVSLNDPGEPDYFAETCSSIYRAMRAKAPWPIPTEPSDEWRAICNHAAAIVKERDEALELLRCSENVRYNLAGRIKELEAGIPAIDTSALLARAEAAEKALVAYQTVEKRTAEREASIHNAIRRGR